MSGYCPLHSVIIYVESSRQLCLYPGKSGVGPDLLSTQNLGPLVPLWACREREAETEGGFLSRREP